MLVRVGASAEGSEPLSVVHSLDCRPRSACKLRRSRRSRLSRTINVADEGKSALSSETFACGMVKLEVMKERMSSLAAAAAAAASAAVGTEKEEEMLEEVEEAL